MFGAREGGGQRDVVPGRLYEDADGVAHLRGEDEDEFRAAHEDG